MIRPRLSGSIASRLMRMNLLVSATALVLACLAFFSYDQITFRRNLITNLDAEAQITASNSVAALTFDDQQSAAITLSALANSPDIEAAEILASDGSPFALYPASGRMPALRHLDAGHERQYWIHGRQVLLARRIEMQGRSIGTVYISAHLRELSHRARQYAIIAFGVLLFCLGAALAATISFRQVIAGPIVSLAETAHIVSREKDYSVRAGPVAGGGELAVLVQAFNEMLLQIQVRDQAVQQAQRQLEQRVEERTAELQAANRELEAFSYTVAHDLRGPLDAIGGLSFIMQRAYSENLDEEGRLMLGRVRLAARNMAALIDDLLRLSRATATQLDRQPVDLSGLARSIMDDLRVAEPERNVEFISPQGAEGNADEGLIRIVLENLLRNSWKYTSHHASARVEFGTMQVSGETIYFVRDDGAGFDPEQRERLFRPFERLHTASQFSGTGVGLATVQRIISRHGGRVWAQGGVEQGAVFFFTLPPPAQSNNMPAA